MSVSPTLCPPLPPPLPFSVPGSMQMGQHGAAVQDYSAALQVQGNSPSALYNRGISRDRVGDLEGAVDDFGAALQLEPGNADCHHNRGCSLRKMVGLWGGGGQNSHLGGGTGATIVDAL